MKVYKSLFRLFVRDQDMQRPGEKRSKLFYALMAVIAVSCIMVPCCFVVGYLCYAFALSLNGESCGLLFIIHFISLFSIVFGISVILNVFYFSGDIPSLLPLPIRTYKLIAAKFSAAYLGESIMQFLVVISGLVGYFIGAGGHPLSYLYALIAVATMPMAPLVYCGILCILLMGFTRFIRNKESARKFAMAFIVLIMVGLVSSVKTLQNVDMDGFALALSNGEVTFMNVMNVVFPTNYLMAQAVETGSIAYFSVYVLANALLLAVFFGVAEWLYLPSVVGMQSASLSSMKHKAIKKEKQKSPAVAYLCKEFRMLMRTPAFFMNCILIHALWPALLYLVYAMQSDNSLLKNFSELYQTGNVGARWIAVLLVVAVSAVLTAANSIASSAITREGAHYDAMKYLPIEFSTQLHAKAVLSILISGFFATLYIAATALFLQIGVVSTCYYIAISMLVVILITYFGLWLDTINPKLAWDDELNALRGNQNVFFNMVYAMLLAATFVGVMFLLYFFTDVSLVVLSVILPIVLVVLDFAMVRLCIKKGSANLARL